MLAVLCEKPENLSASQVLANHLGLIIVPQAETVFQFYLCYREGCLNLLDKTSLKKGGLTVNIDPRPGEQHSYPAPKKDLLAVAVGKKTKTILDATTGWAQDSLALFRMGYQVQCIERSPIMAALIQDGLHRLEQKDWLQNRQLSVPNLLTGDAIKLLVQLQETPECIYLDPMFPPKRKKSALAKKAMTVLRDILGDDLDREDLFAAAWQATGKRLVVKCPDDAEPIVPNPSESFSGKLVRYDVYLK